MTMHFDPSAAATADASPSAVGAMMAPPFSAEARARFQQVLAANAANVTYTVGGVPATEAAADVIDYLYQLSHTGDTATFRYVTGIALTGGHLSADDYVELGYAIDYVADYENNGLHQAQPIVVTAAATIALDGTLDGVLAAFTSHLVGGDVRIGSVQATAAELFTAPGDPTVLTLSAAAIQLFGLNALADGAAFTVAGGELSIGQAALLAGYAVLDLSGAGLVGDRADFFTGATTLSAGAQAALSALPEIVTVADGLSLAQKAILAAADPGVTINAPIADTIAHLATYNAGNQDWDINPVVTGGASVTLTDSVVPAGLLISMLRATSWSGHVSAPGATSIVGSLNDIDNTLGYSGDIILPAGATLTLSDSLLDASYLLSVLANHPGIALGGAGVAQLDGNLDDVASVLAQTSGIVLSGHEAVNVRDITLSQLAAVKTMVATHSSGAVTAALLDSVENLVSQNPTTHAWSVKAGIGAGFSVRIAYGYSPITMAAGAVLALVHAVGDGSQVGLSAVTRFSGTTAELQQMRDAHVGTYYYGVTVTDAAITASTLIALRGTTVYSVETTAERVTGTTTEINKLFFMPNDYAVLSHTVDIVLTSLLRVVDLTGLRASYAEFTSGTVTGTLRDSVENLTGHLADSVGGYTVLDSVAVLAAHGSIVAGAGHVELADTIAHLAGHTTTGGATSYTVVDTLANLTDNDGVVTGGAALIVAADTVAHLSGHTTDGGAGRYTLIDSLSNINGASDTLLGAALGVKLTDTAANVESLAGWSETVFKASLDARGLTIISGHIDQLVDVLGNSALTFSGSETVSVINGATAVQLNVIDAATSGAVSSTVSGTAGELATLTGTGNQYQVTVTDTASVSQLAAIDAATTGNVTYTSVTDTAAHLATLSNGVWTANGYVHDGTTVMVLGDIGEGALAALDAANGSGDVIVAAPAATNFVIATSDVPNYQILASMVFNVIDVAGVQVYELDAPFSSLHGGILNLSGTDGQNTIVFHGYVPDNVGGAHLTMTQSGTTAMFWDAQTHVEVAAISMSLDHAPVQNLVFEDGSGFNLTLVGTTNPVFTMTPFAVG